MSCDDNFSLSSFFILLLIPFSSSLNVITLDRPIKDAGDVLVSDKGVFALGFFSPGNSSRRYVGIWYNKVSERTVVWVANRDNPINDTSGILSIDATGNLALHAGGRGVPVWKTNISAPATGNNNHSAQLLDSGNLLVFNVDRAAAWQSFDYPTHTVLPNMRLGVDRKTGLNRFLASWKSPDDPGTGEYRYSMNLSDSPPQTFIYKGSTRVWRTGSWNGLRWTGVPEMIPSYIFNITYIDNPEEVSIIFSMIDPSIMSRLVLNESGLLQRYTWHGDYKRWVGFWSAPKDQCDFYGHCGANGNCDNSAAGEFECKCLPGFEPESPRDWYLRDGSGGCLRKKGRSVCGSGEGFVRMAGAKVPDTARGAVNRSVGLGECAAECLRNCSCTAYTAADIGGGGGSGSGCITWHGDLMDVRKFPTGGQDFYVRVDAIEFAQYLKTQRSGDKKRKVAAIWGSLAVVVLFVTIFLLCWLLMKKRRGTGKARDLKHIFSSNRMSSFDNSSSGKTFHERGTTADLPFFDFSAIAEATDNFSFANRLGQGGFGTVYKGMLPNGQEVAVKRLAKNSGQGIEEFKNEVTLIAKLQHRNLVRLLGCCIQHNEKMLIYEYLPNKSLDAFIFDKAKGAFLDWGKRFDIVLGIARGMLYLHQDSRLRIIHRDLKASNILLDSAMNPKISDFGMARMFGGDQIEANTNRVVGTYGYMSPEYAMEGFFSIKSDVFSFGVLLLEIISGRKNSSYYEDDSVNLIGHVWSLWQEEKALEAVDSLLGDSYSAGEVLRCIHISLLCVQESANDRPTMSDVVFMMCNDTALPSPKQPAFILKRKYGAADHSSSMSAGAGISLNDLTLTTIEAR